MYRNFLSSQLLSSLAVPIFLALIAGSAIVAVVATVSVTAVVVGGVVAFFAAFDIVTVVAAAATAAVAVYNSSFTFSSPTFFILICNFFRVL